MTKRAYRKGNAFVSGLLDGLSAPAHVSSSADLTVRHSSHGLETDWRLIGDDLRNGLRRYEKEFGKASKRSKREYAA